MISKIGWAIVAVAALYPFASYSQGAPRGTRQLTCIPLDRPADNALVISITGRRSMVRFRTHVQSGTASITDRDYTIGLPEGVVIIDRYTGEGMYNTKTDTMMMICRQGGRVL